MSSTNDRIENQDDAGDATTTVPKDAVNVVADQLICPITLELPVDPVIAEDKIMYERVAIQEVIERAEENNEELRSPSTNEPMGAQLTPVVQVCNAIEELVKTGAIDGDKARKWEERMADETYIASLKEKAEGGDADSMIRLGRHYFRGEHGLENDYAKAYEWFKKGSDKNYPPAMGRAGYCLLYGYGVEKNEIEGIHLITMAATHDGGSAYAAKCLGDLYSAGGHGLSENKDRAKRFLRMVVDGTCKYNDCREYRVNHAKELLEKLTNGDDN